MKQNIYKLIIIFGIILIPRLVIAQNDDLGDSKDTFQELFYEALKQKGIENYDRSAEALLKCIELDKSVPVLYFELGKNYIQLKNFGAAEDALKEAVNKDPNNEWFLDELYGYYVSQKDHKNAIKTVKQLVKFHPDYEEDLASLYVKTEKYDDALEVLDEIDEKHGVSISRDIMRNRIYEVTGRKKDQIKNLEDRVESNPEKESNYLALIFRYSENNEKEKAFETAKELLKMNPESQLAHLALYKFYLDDNEAEKAIESMKIVVKSSEIKPEAKLKVLTDFVQFVSENPKYEADLVEATTLVSSTNNSKTLMELGQYHLSKNDKAKALEYFETALQLEPSNFNALRTVMLLYIDLKQYKQAQEKSSAALEEYPAQPLFYLINGVAFNELNTPKKALESLEMGVDFIIDDTKMESDFYKQISKAYTLLNNTEKAKTFSDKVKNIQSSN
ncbi:tetratricopeptide repeat protein [Neotamlana laminarinivorans]|uniref:Tetratricopeptide repeat protein n=1 Tax=Neotamlana laminarinivorans TaxID=2883124 RepID=A0A9X1HZU3_9FLAO|nr:tetratricopeptide repeat protein [Tamlana laminarinivorans]MCB4798365.1 tetratricopeptide repeat protein [Tamlana laminarinivorans]